MPSKIILITGANSGVGFATSRVLARSSNDFHIIMTGRSLDKVAAAKLEIEAADVKGAISAVQLDVTDSQSIADVVAYVLRNFGRLDVLINNAASGNMDDDVGTRYRACLETNVAGPAMVAAAFRPLMLMSQNPYSIYVGSGQRTLIRNTAQKPTTHEHIRNGDAYIVSKAALNMLAMLDHRENSPDGIKVFVLSPGFVRSNLRGTSEEARSGWGMAGDPEVSGLLALDIILGLRDADVGCLVHKDGIYPW